MQSDRLPLPLLLAHAAPALPLAALTLPLYVLVPAHYAERGASLPAIGAALLAIRLVDAVSDPLAGPLADRIRPPGWRRRLPMLLAMPIVAAAVFALFVPPDTAGAGWLALCGIILSLATTAMIVPYWAWTTELSPDPGERGRAIAWREAAVILGTLVATVLPGIAMLADPVTGQATGLAALAGLIALALPLAVIAAIRKVPEARGMPEHAPRPLREAFTPLYREGAFLRLLSAFVANGLANGLPATLFLFFVSYRLAEPAAAGPLLIAYFLAGLAGIPLWLRLAARIGKPQAWATAMGAAAVVFAFVPLLGPGDSTAFALVCMATGLCLGADLVLPAAIQADIVDSARRRSGRQESGTFVAAWSFGTKVALAVAAGVALPLLAASGFDATADVQPEAALGRLSLLYAGIPALIKVATVLAVWSMRRELAVAGATSLSASR